MVVDLPAPFGPRNPNTSPRVTVRLRSSTATTWPNRLVKPSMRMAKSDAVGAGTADAADTVSLSRVGLLTADPTSRRT